MYSSSGLTGHQNHLRIPADTRRQYAKVKTSYTITYILCSHKVALFQGSPLCKD